MADPTKPDDQDAAREAAARLERAVATGVPCSPVRDLIGASSIALAYRVQDLLNSRRLAAGERRSGRKIGLTSDAVQQQLGVDQPDFGTLFESMRVDDGGRIDMSRLLQPRIEAEVAFVLGADIADEDPSLATVAAAVEYAAASLEIVDSRVAGWKITIADTVADNASSGLYVVADDTRITLDEFDPVAVSMTLSEDNTVVATGTGVACLANPVVALQWLARTAARFGDPLRAGEVVLSGALGPMVDVKPGSVYHASFSELGDVRVEFDGSTTGGDLT